MACLLYEHSFQNPYQKSFHLWRELTLCALVTAQGGLFKNLRSKVTIATVPPLYMSVLHISPRYKIICGTENNFTDSPAAVLVLA